MLMSKSQISNYYKIKSLWLLLSYRDYRPIPALDVYDPAALDDDDFDEMAPEARQEAERLMRKRDREEAAARGRLHRGLLYGTVEPPFTNLY